MLKLVDMAHALDGAQTLLNSPVFYQQHSAETTGKMIQNVARRCMRLGNLLDYIASLHIAGIIIRKSTLTLRYG
jgi:hypothetical protein